MSGANTERSALLARIVGLEQQAKAAHRASEWGEAVRLCRALLDIEPVEGLSGFYANVAYNMACALARMGRADEAMAALDEATRLGFTDADSARADDDLGALRDDPRFDAMLLRMEGQRERLKVYAVRVWDNPEPRRGAAHRFDAMDGADAVRLRALYGLDEVAASGSGPLGVHEAVLDWVHRRWAHNGLMEPSSRDALTILSEVEGGASFRCVEYSVVLAQALHALGHPARVVSLRCEGMSYGVGKGHVVAEAWSDALQKWVVLDGQNNAFWVGVDGVPLSCAEVQARLLRGEREDVHLEHQGSSWLLSPPSPEVWLAYFAYVSIPTDNRIFDREGDAPTERVTLLGPGQVPELLFQGMKQRGDFTRDVGLLYPTLNRVHVRLETPDPGAPEEVVIVHMRHTMPSFSHVEIDGHACDGLAWAWSLEEGVNRFSAVAVNAAGVHGAATEVAVEYFPRV